MIWGKKRILSELHIYYGTFNGLDPGTNKVVHKLFAQVATKTRDILFDKETIIENCKLESIMNGLRGLNITDIRKKVFFCNHNTKIQFCNGERIIGSKNCGGICHYTKVENPTSSVEEFLSFFKSLLF